MSCRFSKLQPTEPAGRRLVGRRPDNCFVFVADRYSDGAAYEGEWREGQRYGSGTYCKPNGDVYEGEWKGDLVDGKGKLRTAHGEVYAGMWKTNRRNGRGRCEYKNGSFYDGEWVDDLREGTTEPMPSVAVATGSKARLGALGWVGWVLACVCRPAETFGNAMATVLLPTAMVAAAIRYGDEGLFV